MAGRDGGGRWRALAAALCAASLCAANPAAAQQAPGSSEPQSGPPPRRDAQIYSLIAVISTEELFQESAFGKAVMQRSEEARRALQTENQRLEAELEAEERDLTARRPGLSPDAFRQLAEAFDTRVKGIRSAQEGKARDLLRRLEEDRDHLGRAAAPVLRQLMVELGAAVVLNRAEVVASLDAVDITDRAIARIDAVLGEGDLPSAAAPPDDAGAAPGAAP